MTESSPTTVFYGSAKAEAAPLPKQESKIVRVVKNAVGKWLDRIGPKNIEKQFIEAHERVLATLNSDQRKELFAKEADKWQKAGKRWGVAATVIDAALIGAGAGLSFIGLRNPQIGANLYADFAFSTLRKLARFDNSLSNSLVGFLIRPFEATGASANSQTSIWTPDMWALTDASVQPIGRTIAITPALASLGILIGSGPGHWLAHLAAGGKEQFGKMRARTHNYVDSGKAAEHAKKVGNAIEKGATETLKYVTEHPEEIRKTVESAQRIKRQNTESAQKLAEAKQKSADAALEAQYQDWIAHHPDKTYYEQSGIPYPSKAEYVEMKQKEAVAKKANLEAEKRGEAKR